MEQVHTLEDSYTKTYKMRTTGVKDRTIEVSVPKDVIIRQSRRVGLTIEEYLDQYRAVAHYNDSDELYYTFKRVKEGDRAKI